MDNKQRVYLDHAATTPVRPEVLTAMNEVYEKHYGNPSTFYQEGYTVNDLLAESRETIAKVINADSSEIYFTSGGTESDNWAIKGTAFARKDKGRHIITSKIEHHAVLHTVEWLEKNGFEATYLDVDQYGLVDPSDLKAALREDTILVSIMTANNEVGTIQPIKELVQVVRENSQALFHTDSVQALGAIKLDVKDLGVDMMSFSAHKLYGPKGVGAMFLRKGLRIDNHMHGGGQERSRRGGTENIPGIVGFAKAVELAAEDMETEADRQIEIRDYIIKEISENIPYAKLNGHPNKRLPNNVNFSFEFIEGESMLLMLDHQGYACSSGSACTSASLDPSHVLLAMGLPHEIAHGSLRITLGRDNDLSQVKPFVENLAQSIARLREMSPLWEDFQKGKIKESIIN